MTDKGLTAPIHKLIEYLSDDEKGSNNKFIAIGDGGNELGMWKPLDQIKKYILRGLKLDAQLRPIV